MFHRPNLNTSLGDLDTLVRERDETSDLVRVAPGDIEFHLDSTDPTIKVGTLEAPATDTALQAFGDLLQVPSAFLKRAQGKVQSQTMNALFTDLVRNSLSKDAAVKVRGTHIQGIDEWGKQGIAPHNLTTAAVRVLGENAQVARLVDEPSYFGFDAYVPEDSEIGVILSETTLDIENREVNDVTAGGLRFGVNLKQGLAPTVEEWLYRFACTNGMLMEKAGLKVDARGQSVDEVLAELESMAQLAFGAVERDIMAFYELKQQRVDNVERAIRAIARERGIPNRSTMALMDLAAGDDVPDNPTMWDIVNLITNFANSPAIGRDGGRIILEKAGGSVVADHAARCSHCQQKVTG